MPIQILTQVSKVKILAMPSRDAAHTTTPLSGKLGSRSTIEPFETRQPFSPLSVKSVLRQFNMLMSNHTCLHSNSNTLSKSTISAPSPRVYGNITKTRVTTAVVGNLFIKLYCSFEEKFAGLASTNAVVNAWDDVTADRTWFGTFMKRVTCEF